MSESVEVCNVNHPDQRSRVNAAKYNAMKEAMRAAMIGQPAMTQSQIKAAVLPHLPEALFPQGTAAGWWAKTVQLDLEARGEMGRAATKPLTFFFT